MIKRVVGYSLLPGTDPEEFWQYHTEVHSADFKRAAGTGQHKYVINRVKKVRRGEPNFFGLVQHWFVSEEAMEEALRNSRNTRLPSGKTMSEDFRSRVTGGFIVIMEEKEIALPRTAPAPRRGRLVKTLALNSLLDKINPDEFWRYHIEVHAPDFRKIAGPGLRKYVISRVIKVVSGEPKFWETVEQWWDSEEAFHTAMEKCRTTKLANGKTLFDDFDEQVTVNLAAFVEEKEISL